MNVVVIGAGRVGLANAIWLSEEHEVHLVDRDPNILAELSMGENPYPGSDFGDSFEQSLKKIKLHSLIPELRETTAVILTIPNDSVHPVIELLSEQSENIGIVIIRSTLSLSTALVLSRPDYTLFDRCVGFPEFLVEGNEKDGVVKTDQNFVSMVTYSSEIESIFDDIYSCTYTAFNHFAEPFFIKVWTNVGLAMKTVLANGIRESIPSIEEINMEAILQGVTSDRRLGYGYLKPGPGYGGSCLPFAVEQVSNIYPFNFIQEYNDQIPQNIATEIMNHSSLEPVVLVFGYNFKRGVADHRNSNQLRTIYELSEKGVKVYVNDDFYSDIVRDYWVENPIKILEEITDVIIFYQTSALEKMEKFFSWDPASDLALKWNSINIIDFR